MRQLPQSKLFRDVESLRNRFAAATQPGRPVRPWSPAAVICTGVLSHLVAMLAAWGTPAAENVARRLTLAFAPATLDTTRLAEIAARYIPRDRARELVQNIAVALADGIEPVKGTIREMIQHRRSKLGLAISDADAAALATALIAACSPNLPNATADVEALGVAIRAIGLGVADAALIQQRMRDALEITA